jgi:glycosyltransferase involved in cell wall biosynthesis
VIAVLLHDLGLGGTERVAIRLANAWARAGCRVLLHVGDARGVQAALVGPGVTLIAADPPIPRGRLSRLRLARWFASACAGGQVQVAFLPGNFYFQVAPRVVAASRGSVRVFAKISNALWRQDRSALRNRLFAALTRQRLRRAAGVIALSPALLQEARTLLGDGLRLVQLPNPVLESLPAVDESLRRPGKLCAVGRLEPQKNFPLLLRAFALLTDLPVTLDIIGDGAQRAMLEQLARELGVAARVNFTGTVDDVPRRLAGAQVMLLASDFEGYPGVVVEALATGTYVVARDCSPAIREMLPGPAVGTVVPGDDPRMFAAAVRRYLDSGVRDPAQMRAIAAAHVADEVAGRFLQAFGLARHADS